MRFATTNRPSELRLRPVINGTAIVVVVALFAALFLFVATYYFPFPFADHLDLLVLLEKYYVGNLGIVDYFVPHAYSHWHAGAYPIQVALALLSHWNTFWEVVVCVVFGVSTFFVLARLVRRTVLGTELHHWFPLLVLPAAWFQLSIDPFENWLWGWQLSLQMGVFGGVAALVLLCGEHVGRRQVVMAIAAAALSTYNFSTGLALWPLGTLILVVQGRRRVTHFRWNVTLWVGCMILVSLHYRLAFEGALHLRTGDVSLFNRLVFSLLFIPPYLGSAVARFTESGVAVALVGSLGILAGLALLYACFRESILPWQRILPWLAVALFSTASGWLIGLGRYDMGLRQAATPRYISFGNLFWVALTVVCLGVVINRSRITRSWSAKLALATLIVACGMKAWNMCYFLDRSQVYKAGLDELRDDVVAYYPILDHRIRNQDKLYFEDAAMAQRFLEVMERYRLNIFHDPR